MQLDDGDGGLAMWPSRAAQRRPRRFGASQTASVALGVACAATVTSCGWLPGAGSQDAALRDRLAMVPEIRAHEATDELCTAEWMLCEEGWSSDVGAFVRFASEGEAVYWETVLGSASRRNGSLLLDMSGAELTPTEQRLAIDTLFTDRDWG